MQQDPQNAADPALASASPGPGELVLLGAGLAHVQVLAQLARRALPGVRITLVAPHAQLLYAPQLSGFVAGRHALEDGAIALEPLVRQSGVRWLQRSVRALDAQAQEVLLDDGSSLRYDWLSVNTGPVHNRALLDIGIPGIRENGLFVRPLDSFAALWPKVAALGDQQALRLAVVGQGAAGVELAFAVRQRLPNAAITLIGPQPVGADLPAQAQAMLTRALRARRITVLTDRVVRVDRDELTLGSGARLASNVSLVALGPQAPLWLQGSGLALDAQGFIAVNACQQSTSHPKVLAAGDVSSRTDAPHAAPPRHAASALQVGPALAHNLTQLLSGLPLRERPPARRRLQLLPLSDGRALIVWGRLIELGRLAAWFKRWRDRRTVARLRAGKPL